MFVITCMPVGGAETLLTEVVRRMDRERFSPELCCLKRFDRLGEELSREVPAFTGLLSQKYNVTVLWRLARLMRRRRVDAVVTVGTGGDKMFWGGWRLALGRAGDLFGVALDRAARSRRVLQSPAGAADRCVYRGGRAARPLPGRARRLPRRQGGGDSQRRRRRTVFASPAQRTIAGGTESGSGGARGRHRGGAAAGEEPQMFLRVAASVCERLPAARFLVVGDGPERAKLESLAASLGVADAVRFLGTRCDVEEVLSLVDVLLLSSHMEANPTCVLEAMAAGKPVVATRVGSVAETVLPGKSGYLVGPGDWQAMAAYALELLGDCQRAEEMGRAGRQQAIARWSVNRMVRGYEDLIAGVYAAKTRGRSPKPEIRNPKPEI